MRNPDPVRSRQLALALLSFLLGLPVPAVRAQSSRTDLIARLDSLAGAPVREGRAVGISVAVVRGTDTLLLRGYGKADIELDVNTPDRAVYEIGSVTKQFTAAAILQLRDEGKLDLDADVTTYLPDYPTAGHRLPLRRLLDHTSGIKGMTEIPAFRELRIRRLPRDSGVAMIAAQPFEFAPGEAMIYNNSAYFLLGLIIEKVSGMSYEDYVEKRLFAPTGMKDSRYCSNTEVVDRRAHGYQRAGQGWRRADYIDHTWPFAAGSLCSTAGDLITWLSALHGGKVLPERSYGEMIAPARLNDGTQLRYGMGLSLGTDPRGARMIGHGGGIPGFTSEARWYPDAQLAVVVLMNSAGPVSPSALASELAGQIITPVPRVARAFTGDASPLVGRYTGPSRGREMTVEVSRPAQGGVTVSVNGDQTRALDWVDGWTFRSADVILVFERRDASGPATVLRFDTGGGHYVLRRNEQPPR
jgi:CubicO group peptidase (beta-lactamase class C family)